MTFLIFNIELTTLVAQPVSVLRAKLWKVVMKCKIVMFLTFAPFFSKFTFSRLQYFMSPQTDSIRPSLALVVGIYKIQVFDKAFFLVATIAMITEKLPFCYFYSNHC